MAHARFGLRKPAAWEGAGRRSSGAAPLPAPAARELVLPDLVAGCSVAASLSREEPAPVEETPGVMQTAAPTEHRDDPALVAACLAGDDRAWQELVRRYGRLVYSIPRRMGMSDADADDVFQNVFASVLRALPTLQDQNRLSSWLITTTRRESWKVAARNKGHADVDELSEVLSAISDEPVADLVRLEREQAVRIALGRLDPKCRGLLTALFLQPEEQSYEEIAASLGMAIGSIGPTRARCFRKLEPMLREVGLDDLS